METKVVGVTFSNKDGSNRAEIISKLSEGDTLYLEHDPCNEYDDNAIKVCTLEEGFQIGFLPRALAPMIVSKLQQGILLDAFVVSAGFWRDKPYCRIRIKEREPLKVITLINKTKQGRSHYIEIYIVVKLLIVILASLWIMLD